MGIRSEGPMVAGYEWFVGYRRRVRGCKPGVVSVTSGWRETQNH
jgi:hypothetical protein